MALDNSRVKGRKSLDLPQGRVVREERIACLVLLAVLLLNGALLRPELAISRVDLNDNVFHFTLIERMAQALRQGENPLDCWSSEWSLGYPVFRTYQSLAHLLVLGAWLMLGKSVSLMTVFVWARFLTVALLPLSFFVAARLLRMRPITASAAAMLAPLVSTNYLYGVEYGSFVWAGSGLFPQSVAAHLVLLALGLGYRAIRQGRQLTLAGVMLGLAFLAHFIYGYIGALSLCLLATMPDQEVPRALRIRRTAWLGAASAALAAFQIAPLLLDSTINHSRWEFNWKWDSFGPGPVLRWLFTGELLDHGRLPMLTLLAFGGAAWFFWRRWRRKENDHPHAFVLLGAGFWIAVFIGRPLWGPLLDLLGVSRDMQLHRVLGGAQIFLVLLAASALTALGGELGRRRRFVATAIALGALLFPIIRERWQYLDRNGAWGKSNLAAREAALASLNAVLERVKERGGRVYPGMAFNWGGSFRVGDVPFYAFLSTSQVPAVSFLYHSMALTGDVMMRFDERNPDHYRLFNIQTVVAPAEGGPSVPPFDRPTEHFGPFRILEAPGGGYFDLVELKAAVTTSRSNFYEVNDRWLASNWPSMRQHLLLDWNGTAPVSMSRIPVEGAMPPAAPVAPLGTISGEQRRGEVYDAHFHVTRDCYVLFKMTWHPNWRADLDGRRAPTVMISPGFPAVALTAGEHYLRFHYQPEWWRGAGAIAGVLLALAMAICESRALAARRRVVVRILREQSRRRALTAAGLLLLALPVAVPLFSGKMLAGHDASEYSPRLAEFHENISHGILLPRWAPDLTNGNGQPFFVFNPPLMYYAGEFFHLLGFSLVSSLNLACAAIVLASSVAMFLLGRLYFGERGGWLAAAGLLYAPYFAVDLYVRSAMAEFAAFPFFALALYGFGAYAKRGEHRALLLGAAAYSGVLVSHNAAALLFTPLLLAFLVFTSWTAGRWSVLWRQSMGFLLGLGLAAAVWLPCLVERGDLHLYRLLQGYLRYSNHFVYPRQLFYSQWGYGISVAGPDDQMSFSLGWSLLVLAALAWILMAQRRHPEERRAMVFFAAAGTALCLFMLPYAKWLWDSLPLVQYVEFPWRLLGPATICLAMVVAAFACAADVWPRWRNWTFAAALAIMIVPNLSHLAPAQTRDVDPALSTPHAIASSGIEPTTASEYVPRWVHQVAPHDSHVATVVDGDADIRQLAKSPVSWSAEVTATRLSTLKLAISWFPGWQVLVDDTPVGAQPSAPTGQIRFEVPIGVHRVQVEWTRTGIVRLGDVISVLSWTTLAMIWLRPRRYGNTRLLTRQAAFAMTSVPSNNGSVVANSIGHLAERPLERRRASEEAS